MDSFVTIISAVLVFGFLIFIHEFGHFITARMFGVTVNEFAIGMGPKLITYDSKKSGIQYSIGILPIGGYVAMAGEDSESDDPNSFDKKPAWQRFIITAAGATVNILFGFLAMILLVSITVDGNTQVGGFISQSEFTQVEGFEYVSPSSDYGLEVGDLITHVNGKSVVIYEEFSYEIMRQGNNPVDLTVIRDGKTEIIEGVVFPKLTQQGQVFGIADIKVSRIEKDFFNIFSISFRRTALVMRMCWESIYDLITGRYSVGAISGPVGISGAIGDAVAHGFSAVLEITVLISINLGFMNLLPIPALDGGRLIVILVEMITKKRLPPKVEGIINSVGLFILLGLSLVIMVKDVIQLL